MDPDVQTFAAVSVIIVGLCASLCAIGTITYRVLVKRAPPPRSAFDDERLEHLQQSVDAIAIEVERIAEAQRFSARLLAEHPDRISAPR